MNFTDFQNQPIDEFVFSGEIEIVPIEKEYGSPANGISPVTSHIFARPVPSQDKIYFWAEFSETDMYHFIKIISSRGYKGCVDEELTYLYNKIYRSSFMILEPIDGKCILDMDFRNGVVNKIEGIGRLYNYPFANNNLLKVIYHIRKIGADIRLIGVDWTMDKQLFADWMKIRGTIRRIRIEGK